MCICMGTKTISIMDDAYDLLVKNKSKNESFSDVIRKLAKKGDIMKFAGALSITNSEAEEMKKSILNLRKKGSKELIKKVKNL